MTEPTLKILQNAARLVRSKLLDFFLPASCILCETATAEHGACCSDCWTTLRHIEKPICPITGSPFSVDFGEELVSAEALANPPLFERLRAPVIYEDNARKLVTGLKFHNRIELALPMARWMVRAGAELFIDKPIIVPVPLHRARLWSRRYNQSAELARHIAAISDLKEKYNPLILKRKKPTKQQVGLTENQRKKNVSGAFQIAKDAKISLDQANILLIDDVYTTGATVTSAIRCLKRAGAKKVDVLVFAKVETQLL